MSKSKINTRFLSRVTLQITQTAIELQLKQDVKDKIKDEFSKSLFNKSLKYLKEQHIFQGSINVGGKPF